MTVASVTASAPAKINLHLGVGAVRADGYHPLATVYQAVGLLDEVTVAPAPEYSVTVSGNPRLSLTDVPLDDTNIAVRAARRLAEHAGIHGAVTIRIDKGIPVAGGMAGGSADAAATLVACDALWGLEYPREVLMQIAAELGSDVPFALTGGTAVGSGRGELVAPAMVSGDYWWVVVESPAGLSTPAVYAEYDALHDGVVVAEPEIPEDVMEALRNHDLPGLAAAMGNDLEPAALRIRPELREVLTAGVAAGALGSLLSGSGPTCLFLCDGKKHTHQLLARLRDQGFGPMSMARGPVGGARIERTG